MSLNYGQTCTLIYGWDPKEVFVSNIEKKVARSIWQTMPFEPRAWRNAPWSYPQMNLLKWIKRMVVLDGFDDVGFALRISMDCKTWMRIVTFDMHSLWRRSFAGVVLIAVYVLSLPDLSTNCLATSWDSFRELKWLTLVDFRLISGWRCLLSLSMPSLWAAPGHCP